SGLHISALFADAVGLYEGQIPIEADTIALLALQVFDVLLRRTKEVFIGVKRAPAGSSRGTERRQRVRALRDRRTYILPPKDRTARRTGRAAERGTGIGFRGIAISADTRQA